MDKHWRRDLCWKKEMSSVYILRRNMKVKNGNMKNKKKNRTQNNYRWRLNYFNWCHMFFYSAWSVKCIQEIVQQNFEVFWCVDPSSARRRQNFFDNFHEIWALIVQSCWHTLSHHSIASTFILYKAKLKLSYFHDSQWKFERSWTRIQSISRNNLMTLPLRFFARIHCTCVPFAKKTNRSEF